MVEVQDQALAERAAAGDAAAFAALIERMVPRLHRWLVATGCRHHDAEDVVQEACLRAHRAIRSYDRRWAFSTWLFTIAHRVRLDQAVRRRDHAPLSEVPCVFSPEEDPLPVGGLWARARSALAPEDYRLLWLHYAEDQSPSACAAVLGISSLAARVRLHRARRRLEAALRAHPALIPAEIMP